MMLEDERIGDLKERFNSSIDWNIQRSSLEVLATYGIKGIDAINELIGLTLDNDLRGYGLNLIKQVRASNNFKKKYLIKIFILLLV